MDVSALHTLTEEFAAYLSEVTAGDLSAPTPCEGWDVGHLYRHMIEENVHFGLAASGADHVPADVESLRSVAASASAALPPYALETSYRRTSSFMGDAFARVADAEGLRRVPGVPGERTVHDLYEMQLCDTLIHTWDLAHALGLGYDPEPEIAGVVLRRMESVPESARGPGRAFGEVQSPVDRAASTLDRIVVLSGRAL